MIPEDYWQYAYAADKPPCSVCGHPFLFHLKGNTTELRVHNPDVPACRSESCICPGYMPVKLSIAQGA